MDKLQFGKGMAMLGETFNREISPTLADIYYKALDDISDSNLETAFNLAVTQCKFFPKPVELRELAGVVAITPPSLNDQAQMAASNAWGEVIGAIRSGGRESDLSEPVRKIIRNMGGLYAIGGLSSETVNNYTRKDFERTYIASIKCGHIELKSITPGGANCPQGAIESETGSRTAEKE